jgi:hypothetical protein
VWNLVARALDLDRRDARERAQLKARICHPVRRANERLGEIHRVLDDGDQGQILAMADEVLHESGLLAPRNAVAPKPALLEMSGGHLEHVAFPLTGREALPRVLRVGGWTRTSVHVDHALRQHPHHRGVPRDYILRYGIHCARNPHAGRTAGGVVGRMRLALPLQHRPFARVPRIGSQTCGVVDRQSQVVADLGAGAALRKVFVESLSPAARELDVRESRGAQHGADGNGETAHMKPMHRHGRYLANGSGRSWNLTTALRVPRPPSICQTALGP